MTEDGAGDRPDQERTIGQLVVEISRDLSDIVRHEIALAKLELAASARNAAAGGGMFGIAAVLVVLAIIVLVIAGGYGLVAAGLEPWAAFLVLGGGLLVLAGLLALIGVWRVRKAGPPKRAIRAAQETLAAVRPAAGPTQ